MNAALYDELKQTRPFASIQTEVLVNTMHTAGAVQEAIAGYLAQWELTPQQYNILRILRGAGEQGLPVLEIRERMINRVPDITRLVDRLERAGLAVRRRSVTDRRVVRVMLTKTGLERANAIDEPLLEFNHQITRDLSVEKLSQLNRLLDQLRTCVRHNTAVGSEARDD